MLKSKVLDYIDNVMSKIETSKEIKVQLENEFLRHVIEASDGTSADDVEISFCPSEKLADEITKKLVDRRKKD